MPTRAPQEPTLAEIRKRHRMVLPGSYYVAGQCAVCDDAKGCGQEWPCDAAVLLAEIERLESENAALRKRVGIIDNGLAGLKAALIRVAEVGDLPAVRTAEAALATSEHYHEFSVVVKHPYRDQRVTRHTGAALEGKP